MPSVPAVPAIPAAPVVTPAGVPTPQLKREVKKVILKKVPVAVVKALPPKQVRCVVRKIFFWS